MSLCGARGCAANILGTAHEAAEWWQSLLLIQFPAYPCGALLRFCLWMTRSIADDSWRWTFPSLLCLIDRHAVGLDSLNNYLMKSERAAGRHGKYFKMTITIKSKQCNHTRHHRARLHHRPTMRRAWFRNSSRCWVHSEAQRCSARFGMAHWSKPPSDVCCLATLTRTPIVTDERKL